MTNPADTIRKIELKLDLGDAAKGVEMLRRFVDSETLPALESNWAIQILKKYGDDARVERLVQSLLEQEKGSERARLLRADLLRESGRFADAEVVYREALSSNPRSGWAIYYLSSMGALRDSDVPDDLFGGPPTEDQAMARFALGKMAEDSQRYGEAMEHFDAANEIASQCKPATWKKFNLAANVAEDEAIKLRFNSLFVSKWSKPGRQDDRPIFIVGLPRSGSTLLERILGRHPEVHAAGELPFWTKRSPELMIAMRSYPAGALPMAEKYESLLDLLAPGARRVVDKNPMNAKLAGALHILMPNARFISIERKPVDNCLSMYKTFGGAPKDLAFSKRFLVDGYRLNESLMAHWADVLPADRFLKISYEELVFETEKTTRKVFDFCDLEWSEGCMRDSGKGAVRTPSAWQVRQPIYQSSIGAWQNYEPWLGEFRELAPVSR